MHQDMTCRLCNETEESQEHILEKCKNEKRTELGKVTTQDTFEENTEKLTDSKLNKKNNGTSTKQFS